MPTRRLVGSGADCVCLSFLAVLLLVLLAPLSTGRSALAQSAAVHPNIVWITTEDMSAQLGAYGDPIARTPNVDRLAAEGIRYTNTFAVSGVCAPNRSALITGLYPSSYGAQHMRTMRRTAALDQITDPELLAIPTYEAVPPPEVRAFPELLRRHGYYTTNNAKEDYQFAAPITVWDESSETAHWRNRPDPRSLPNSTRALISRGCCRAVKRQVASRKASCLQPL